MRRLLATLALAALTGSCGGGDGETGGVESFDAARGYYRDWGCPLCHGDGREGTELGPALENLEASWDAESLADYLRDPERFRRDDPRVRELRTYYPEVTMPEYDRPEPERRLLAEWLLTSPPD